MIANEGGRILSVKLRGYWLVTLAEDNVVRLYQYETAKGFQPKSKWAFGDPSQPTNIVECVDLLPEINILVVAFRGSKHPTEPIQILKGGSHPWFVPDSICLSRDYFAVCGRKPSAVFVWNWRKGVRLSNRAFDNQPYSVYLSGDNLIAMSVDGLVYIFDLFDHTKDATLSTTLPPCSMPCLQYDGTLSVVLAPFASRRVHHFQWNSAATEAPTTPSDQNPPPVVLTSSTSTPHPTLSTRRRLSATLSSSVSSLLGRSQKKPKKRASVGSCTKSLRLRRHSSYNDYGYACQMRTAQYIKKAGELKPEAEETPDLTSRLKLIHSVRTTPLGRTAQEVVNVASRNGRVVTVNRHGDMAMYALNGATAARVTFKSCEWMESWDETAREDDDLSDGYDFVRTRLAIGDMGIVYGCRGGALWWLDFGCRPNA
ncbi:hypothetical protein DFQ28_000945 [Apophysomyces sp. BC1034]|nr:hypothetical protein DFQ28_000945 [Apophysomyces sp. BC1034]